MTRPFILVEDDHHKAKPVLRLAQRAGFEPVLRAVNLAEALDLIDRYGGVVLTDWSFPLRKGYGVCEDAGARVVIAAREARCPVRVFSGRDVPAEGYEDIWFDAAGVNGLMAWIEEEGKK